MFSTSAWRPANLTSDSWFSLVLAGRSRGSTKLSHFFQSLFTNCIIRSCRASLKKPELSEMLDIDPRQFSVAEPDGRTPGACCRLVAVTARPNTKRFKMSETFPSSFLTIETYRLNRSEPLRMPCVESITSRYPSCGIFCLFPVTDNYFYLLHVYFDIDLSVSECKGPRQWTVGFVSKSPIYGREEAGYKTIESFCGRKKLWSGTKHGISLRKPRPVSGCRTSSSVTTDTLFPSNIPRNFTALRWHSARFWSGVSWGGGCNPGGVALLMFMMIQFNSVIIYLHAKATTNGSEHE